MEAEIEGRTILLIRGDITDQETDAIVNAANKHLQLGSGVAGAIRQHGGPSIQRECDVIGYCPVGGAVITGAGNLKARFVIHAVGPLVSDPDAAQLLESATLSSFQTAERHHLESIAFPAISTGVFGYPVNQCAQIMLAAAVDYLRQPNTSLKQVVFCLYDQLAFDAFRVELIHQTKQS